MKLADALEIVQRPATGGGEPFAVALACGFQALHLRTFLAAELIQRLPQARVDVHTGLFDDLPGNIERATSSGSDAIAVIIEWPDLDPRLGLRRLGGWRADQLDDIVTRVQPALDRLERAVLSAATGCRVVCVMPTLPLPPLFPQPPARSGPQELALRRLADDAACRLATAPAVSMASLQRLDELSPPAARRDVKGELASGFPYSLGHASATAGLVAELLWSPVPRKGLITDLDDTLWAGLLDEAGPQEVAWTGTAHAHGLYQQLLASLASAGVMIGVASRNDPGLVAEALGRRDLLIPRDALYPVEVGWGDKSRSIRRILEIWGVGADAAVFVDDSPLERAEARERVPGLLTVSLPSNEDGLWPFLGRLRALFGKGEVSAEDGLRVQSIRAAQALSRAQAADQGPDDFLAGVAGVVEFGHGTARGARALELIGKATQFNLNGRRLTEAELARATDRGSELVTVSYEDRYGALGLIAALLVTPGDAGPAIETWVMSCRAFARRVEHHTLRHVFDRFGADDVTVAFHPTPRNVAVRDFLASVNGHKPRAPVRLTRAAFDRAAPPLVHRVVDDEP
jgi:FkbH-like protein